MLITTASVRLFWCLFTFRVLETSAATYSIDESGSIQAEGYSINSVVGNLTTADDLRVDGGKLDF